MKPSSREGQVWRDFSDGQLVMLYCYGEPFQDRSGRWRQRVVLLDQGRGCEWNAHAWEDDPCMTRIL